MVASMTHSPFAGGLAFKRRRHSWLLARAQRLLEGLPPGQAPTLAQVGLLSWAWGNPGYSASLHLLKSVGRLATVQRGPVLECGSGATTMLLGILGRTNGFAVQVLEHHAEWARHMGDVLRAQGLANVTVHHAPLKSYGEFEWYDTAGLEAGAGFSLVLCDGPPRGTRGGRYGLLPVMGDRLLRPCHIVMDDMHRSGEREILDAWRRRWPLTTTELGAGLKDFAVVSLGSPPPP
jgi:hypothetical protein